MSSGATGWTTDCQQAFDTLWMALTTEPVVLRYLNWQRPFVVEADASNVAIAAVLSEWDASTGGLQPMSYFSSALDSSQKNYSAGQKETLNA